MNNNLFDYYRNIGRQNVILAFSGSLSDKVLVGMIEMIKTELDKKAIPKKITKKVYSVCIELGQNIYLHSADKRRGLVVIKEHDDGYIIKSGNLIENDKIHTLVTKINYINQLDKNELRKLFCEKLKNPEDLKNPGGRIGLLVIARKSEHPIGLTIHLVDEFQSFIEFSIKINKEVNI